MLYAILCEDIENSLPLRQKVRHLHIERLGKLQSEGRLVLAGPHPAIESNDPGQEGFTGTLVVAEFESLAEAKNWLDEDPYVKEGVFSSSSIKPFKQVLP